MGVAELGGKEGTLKKDVRVGSKVELTPQKSAAKCKQIFARITWFLNFTHWDLFTGRKTHWDIFTGRKTT